MTKRILAALTALAMLILSLTGLAEASDAPAMPAIGDVINGFELIETRDYPMIGAVIYRFEHQRTGAEAFYIANEDTNRVFTLVFHTQAIDKTGLPHVFEHATLSGSKKYPSKDLWFNLANGSYNTFMNAMTFSNATIYPIASLSEAQLLKFADFYTDCCLNPSIMEDESIYREEAWRYRMNSMDDPLTLEGTVYSEMLGAMTLQRWAHLNNASLVMQGAYTSNVSGGDPDYIPDMTYDSLRAYHDRFYHPSNCAAYLYGKLDHYDEFLKQLDEAFAPFEKREYTFEEPDYVPLTEPVEASFTCPMEAGAQTENASTVYYSFVIPGMNEDFDTRMRISTLPSLLMNGTSTLSQTMQRVLPQVSWSCSLQEDGPEDYLAFVCSNCNPEDMQTFRETVDAGLRDVVENGFPQALLDMVTPQLEIAKKLSGESSELGVSLIEALCLNYINTGNPWEAIDGDDYLPMMDEWNKAGVYGELVEKYLIDSPLTALSVTSPAPGEKEKKDAALAQRLAEVKAGMTEDELNAVIEASNAELVENPETADMIRSLTAVTVQSLPEECRIYDIADVTGEDHIRRIDAVANVDGVSQAQIYLDAQGLPQEDIHWMHLYTDLAGSMDTGAHTWDELSTLWGRYLYGGSIALSLLEEDVGTANPRLLLSWIALDDDLAMGYDLMREIMFDTRFDDVGRLTDLVNASLNSLRSGIISDARTTEFRRSMGIEAEHARYSSYYNGLEYYDFLKAAAEQCEKDPQPVIEGLQRVQAFFNNSFNAISACAGNEASIALNRTLADDFLSKLDSRPAEPVHYDLPVASRREALIVDTNVQFNGITASLESLGYEYNVEMEVLSALVDDLYLLPVLRTQYGAYGAYTGLPTDYGVYLMSYRDPGLRNTFDVYDKLPDWFDSLELDQDTLNNYILNVYKDYALSAGELTGAVTAITDTIENWPQETTFEKMKTLKALTPERIRTYADYYRNLVEKGNRYTAGGASAVNECADLFDDILNPFGTADRSQQALTDIAEGDPDYEIVRYVFEEGFMPARADGSFGVDDPANTGDLAGALYKLIGGSSDDPEAAVAALAEYGILLDTDTADAPLTAWDCEDILASFSAAIGVEYPGGFAVDLEVNGEAPAEAETSEGAEAPAEAETSEGTEAPAEAETSEGTEAPAEAETSEGTEAPVETETSDGTEAPVEAEPMTRVRLATVLTGYISWMDSLQAEAQEAA